MKLDARCGDAVKIVEPAAIVKQVEDLHEQSSLALIGKMVNREGGHNQVESAKVLRQWLHQIVLSRLGSTGLRRR